MGFNYFNDGYYFLIKGFFDVGIIAVTLFCILRMMIKMLFNPVRDMFFTWMNVVMKKKKKFGTS